MFGESSHHQCCCTHSSHVPRRLKSQFVASSVSSGGSYSIATSSEKDLIKFFPHPNHPSFAGEGKCYVWGLVPWAAKTFSQPLQLDTEDCVHAQASNQFAAVITSVFQC